MLASPQAKPAALLTGGPGEFVTLLARLLAESGSKVFSSGPLPPEATELKAVGTGSGRTDCAEIQAQGYSLTTLIIGALWNPALLREVVAEEIHALVEYLKAAKEVSGVYPRYVVVLLPQTDCVLAAAGGAALRTLVGYLTRHLLAEDVRINLCSCPGSSLGAKRAAEAAFTLCSGLLDEMRGQELIIADN